jgi:probable F420-dependent oxidoreductase
MRHGLILMAQRISEQVELARAAERRGFDSVWTTEFFNQHGLVRLAAVAAGTTQIRVGTAISYAFMRSPVLSAAAALDIDELSGGRMVLGLGSGTRSMNESWYSMPFDAPPAPRMREAIELIRSAFAAQHGGGLRYEGRHYKVSIPQYARPGAPRAQIPIYLAAVNRGMIRCAARAADGLIGHPIFTRRYLAEVVRPELEQSRCVLAPYVICSIAADPAQARREARAQIAFYYTTRLYHSVLELDGWRAIGEEIAAAFRRGEYARMADLVPDELVDAIAITGRPDEVREQLRQWDGLCDCALLYAPTVGVKPERVRENLAAIVETFAQG